MAVKIFRGTRAQANSDMIARKSERFEENDVSSKLCKRERGECASRPAANDRDLATRGFHQSG